MTSNDWLTDTSQPIGSSFVVGCQSYWYVYQGHQEFPPVCYQKTKPIAFSHCCMVVIRFHFLPFWLHFGYFPAYNFLYSDNLLTNWLGGEGGGGGGQNQLHIIYPRMILFNSSSLYLGFQLELFSPEGRYFTNKSLGLQLFYSFTFGFYRCPLAGFFFWRVFLVFRQHFLCFFFTSMWITIWYGLPSLGVFRYLWIWVSFINFCFNNQISLSLSFNFVQYLLLVKNSLFLDEIWTLGLGILLFELLKMFQICRE